MSKPIIAVDIDDVMSSQNEAMRLFVNKFYGLSFTKEDYAVENEDWGYWFKIWNVDDEEGTARWRAFMDNGGLQSQVPEPQSVEVLTALKNRFSLVIITARQEEFGVVTREWLDKHFHGLFDEVHFTPVFHGGKKSKAEVAKELGAQYLIDDNIGHCRLAAEAGLDVILFGDYGWNRLEELPENVTRCKDWLAVKEYFANGV